DVQRAEHEQVVPFGEAEVHAALLSAHPRAAGARTALARVVLGAGVAALAGGAVGLRGIRALAGGGIARSGVVALVGGRPRPRVRADTSSVLAGVRLRAGVVVVAGRAVRGHGARALPRTGVARARDVTLVLSGADDAVAQARGRAAHVRAEVRLTRAAQA